MIQPFPSRLTKHLQSLVESGTDSIIHQYVPTTAENDSAPDDLSDPIGDDKHSPVAGIVHRYPDRVLLLPVKVCAAYCRFCFRRETVGQTPVDLTDDELNAAFHYIETHKEVWEVILSGGDPLILKPEKLGHILDRIESIDHVQVLRIHTRLPVQDPQRITDSLAAVLHRRKALYVVLHVNHADELTPETDAALDRLHKAGCVLLSQSVLLKGVNDDAKTLETLFRALVIRRIKPYYLHHPDKAQGTAHFRLPIAAGQKLMKVLRWKVSGLCQPTYVLDIPHGFGKVPIMPSYLRADHKIEDCSGEIHDYKDD